MHRPKVSQGQDSPNPTTVTVFSSSRFLVVEKFHSKTPLKTKISLDKNVTNFTP